MTTKLKNKLAIPRASPMHSDIGGMKPVFYSSSQTRYIVGVSHGVSIAEKWQQSPIELHDTCAAPKEEEYS